GPYALEAALARGAMATVYRARHGPTGAARAVKVVPASDPEAIVRFRREAEALARVSGAGIVAIHDIGVERGQLWFAMDLLDGGSLRERLRREGKLAWRDAAQLGVELARVLERCHAAGIVHRDVKPDNV